MQLKIKREDLQVQMFCKVSSRCIVTFMCCFAWLRRCGLSRMLAQCLLVTLQAELLSLKQEFGSKLHLKKAPADVLTAPFPILASFVVDAPAAAESYDVSSVKVRCHLVSPGIADL